jgi:hypothetical protein
MGTSRLAGNRRRLQSQFFILKIIFAYVVGTRTQQTRPPEEASSDCRANMTSGYGSEDLRA